MSNPNCPWHKEPYPKEVLEANKRQERQRKSKDAIRLANQYSNIVVAVAVGNEALVDWNDHMVPVDSVISYVRKVKKSISQPVTVADNYNWWVASRRSPGQGIGFRIRSHLSNLGGQGH